MTIIDSPDHISNRNNNLLDQTLSRTIFSDICKNTNRRTPSRKNASHYKGNKLWLRSRELEYKIINSSKERITKTDLENSNSRVILQKTILIPKFSNNPDSYNRVILNNNLGVVAGNETKISIVDSYEDIGLIISGLNKELI